MSPTPNSNPSQSNNAIHVDLSDSDYEWGVDLAAQQPYQINEQLTAKIREYAKSDLFALNRHSTMIDVGDYVTGTGPNTMRYCYPFRVARGYPEMAAECASMSAAKAMTVRSILIGEVVKCKPLWGGNVVGGMSVLSEHGEGWDQLGMYFNNFSGAVKSRADLSLVMNPIAANRFRESDLFHLSGTTPEQVEDPKNPNRRYKLGTHAFGIRVVVANAVTTTLDKTTSKNRTTYTWPDHIACLIHQAPREAEWNSTIRIVSQFDMLVETRTLPDGAQEGRVIEDLAVIAPHNHTGLLLEIGDAANT